MTSCFVMEEKLYQSLLSYLVIQANLLSKGRVRVHIVWKNPPILKISRISEI